jgi:NAD(P)H-hydrate epimerase
MKLVTSAEIRAIEASAFAAGATPAGVMENAGRAVAVALAHHLGSARGRRIVVLVGPGNNGGDGLVAARYLEADGASVSVFLLTKRPEDDPNLSALRAHEDVAIAQLSAIDAAFRDVVARADGVIDAVLGTGRQRPLEGLVAEVFETLKTHRKPLFALDLPTGVDADTGAVDPHAAAADVTLTLGYSKLGLHIGEGAAHAGRVEVLDIGLDPRLGDGIATELLTPEWARAALPDRPANSNKGTFGRVLVVAGSPRYLGAAGLACLGALRAGAGLVTLASVAPVRAAVAAYLPEVTHLPLPEADGESTPDAGAAVLRDLEAYDVLLIGPGLGQSTRAQMLVRGLLSAVESLPVVIDADALNALAKAPDWPSLIAGHAVLTPHPGELARLVGSSVKAVQASRVDMARGCAAVWEQTLVLKGANTLVAQADGRVLVSPFANAALATAGTGDVLAGAIAALIAQGVEPFAAAGLGVYLHGAAAAGYEADYGPSGLLASELGAGIAKVAAALRRG